DRHATFSRAVGLHRRLFRGSARRVSRRDGRRLRRTAARRACAGRPAGAAALSPAFSGHYGVVATAKSPHGATGIGGAKGTKGNGRRVGTGRTGGGARAFGRALRFPVTGTARGIRRATHAHGAGESGLGKLIELHGVNGAGDVMITVALASTVFFSVPTDEARGRVALYLAITMAPFTLLAPVVGPLLDRLPHGRRA